MNDTIQTLKSLRVVHALVSPKIGQFELVEGGLSVCGGTGIKENKPFIHIKTENKADDGLIFLETRAFSPGRYDREGWAVLFDGPYLAQHYRKGGVIFVVKFPEMLDWALANKEQKVWPFRKPAEGIWLERHEWRPFLVHKIEVPVGYTLSIFDATRSVRQQPHHEDRRAA